MATGAFKKAIVITAGNLEYLADRFSPIEQGETDLEPGYYLVAPFGEEDGEYDLLGQAAFREHYAFTGNTLENGFFEVYERVSA